MHFAGNVFVVAQRHEHNLALVRCIGKQRAAIVAIAENFIAMAIEHALHVSANSRQGHYLATFSSPILLAITPPGISIGIRIQLVAE